MDNWILLSVETEEHQGNNDVVAPFIERGLEVPKTFQMWVNLSQAMVIQPLPNVDTIVVYVGPGLSLRTTDPDEIAAIRRYLESNAVR
jgi:hypothetical protein